MRRRKGGARVVYDAVADLGRKEDCAGLVKRDNERVSSTILLETLFYFGVVYGVSGQELLQETRLLTLQDEAMVRE